MNLQEGNDNSSPIERSARILNDLVSELKALMDDYQTERHGLHIGYLSLFFIYTIRQVRAICILVGDESAPYYAEQAGQLLRCLCEIHAKAAWMMKPDNEQEQTRRARCLQKASVKRERLSDHKEQELLESLGITAYEKEYFPLKNPPQIRQMLEIESPDLYKIYQYESSAIHMSSTTLLTTVHSVDPKDRNITLDGPNPLSSPARRLCATLDVLYHTSRVFISGLGLDLRAWEDVEAVRWREIVSLLSPLLSET